MGFNKIIVQGNLTRNPELRFTPSGTPVCSFGLAVNRRYKQGNEVKEEVTFIDVVIYGKQAEHCAQYLTKGSSVLVEGRLIQRRWETEDHQKRSKHEITAQGVTFLSKAGAQAGSGSHDAPHDVPAEDPVDEGEEVPA